MKSEMIKTRDDFKALSALSLKSAVCVLDTETTGFHAYKADKPFLLQMYFPDINSEVVFLIPLLNYGVKEDLEKIELTQEEIKAFLSDIFVFWFAEDKKELIGHNLKFDMHMLLEFLQLKEYKKSTDIKCRFVDTLPLTRIVKNNLFSYSLKNLGEYFDLKSQKDDAVEAFFEETKIAKAKRKYKEVPASIMNNYAFWDVVCTYELYETVQQEALKLAKRCCSGKNLFSVLEDEIAVTKILFFMERRGVTVDLRHLEACIKHYSEKESLLEFKFIALTGEEYVSSVKHLEPILKKFGLELWVNPSTGNASASETVLKKLKHPLTDLILEIRGIKKLVSTYLEPLQNFIGHDGKIHTNFLQTGAASLRMSCMSPNLQNFPRQTDEGFDVRAIIKGTGHNTLLSVDFAAQELRTILDLAGEKEHIQLVKKGKDLHQHNANIIKCDRTKAKSIIFAKNYGAGAGTIAANLNISFDEAQKLVEKFDAAMPNVKKFVKKTNNFAKAKGYILTSYGNPLFINKDFFYKAGNFLIQGTGAIMTKKALIAWDTLACKYNDLYPVIAIHDEILAEVSDESLAIEKEQEFLDCFRNSYASKNGLGMDAEYSMFMDSWKKT